MAEIQKLKLELKIHDLDTFKELVEALGAWVEEVHTKKDMTQAEYALLKAAVDLADETEK